MAIIEEPNLPLQDAAQTLSDGPFQVKPNWARWFRPIIVLGVLATAVMLGLLITRKNPLYGIIAASVPLFLLGLEFILTRFDLASLAILTTAAFVPLSLPTGTGSRLVASLLLTILFVILWVLRVLAVKLRFQLHPSPVNMPLLGFSLVTLFSLIWSNIYRDPLVFTWETFTYVQIASAVVMIMLPGAFLLVANHINSQTPLKTMVAIMLCAGVLGLLKQYGLANLPVNTGGLFTMWVISLSAGLALYNRQMSWVKRGLLLVLAGAWAYWGFGLHITWLAGWLSGFVALGVLSFMRSKKLAALLLIGLLIIVALNPGRYLSDINSENQSSGVTRLAAWEVNWRITSRHWLFGTGPAGYAAYYIYYFPHEAMATHSNYLDILSQTGLIGFGLCIWFFVSLTWMGYKLCKRLRGRGDFSEALANAALAGTVGCIVMMGFGDWLFPFAYTQTIAGFDYAVYNWLFMAAIVALERLTSIGATAGRPLNLTGL